MLIVLISLFAPISGAHFNPASRSLWHSGAASPRARAATYIVAQIAGCCAGALLLALMFSPLQETSTHARAGAGQWISEVVARSACCVIQCRRSHSVPWLVAAESGAAYWFTASTSFANPAITIARTLSDTFAGIRPSDVPAFIVAQIIGMLLASACAGVSVRAACAPIFES